VGLADKLKTLLKGWQLKRSYNLKPSLSPEEFEKFIKKYRLEERYKGFVDYRARRKNN